LVTRPPVFPWSLFPLPFFPWPVLSWAILPGAAALLLVRPIISPLVLGEGQAFFKVFPQFPTWAFYQFICQFLCQAIPARLGAVPAAVIRLIADLGCSARMILPVGWMPVGVAGKNCVRRGLLLLLNPVLVSFPLIFPLVSEELVRWLLSLVLVSLLVMILAMILPSVQLAKEGRLLILLVAMTFITRSSRMARLGPNGL
jgi:hypothetical protein